MKKLFTMIAVGAAIFAGYTASAGNPVHTVKGANLQTTSASPSYTASNLRSTGCDTLLNENILGLDTPNVYLSGSPNVGYFSGNGALNASGTFYPQIAIGEKFSTTVSTPHVTSAFIVYGYIVINAAHADSAQKITAYVYDTTGTSLIFNQYAPGNVLDSASVTLGSIASDITNGQPTLFNFTHQPQLANGAFFVTTTLPLTTGDTLAVATNQGTTGDGNAWLELSAGGQAAWGSYDSLAGTPIGSYIIAIVCSAASSTCPTITVTATEISHATSAYATASGGTGPYTYSWSSSAATDTATGLTNGQTYTVTATDHNGCTGAGTVSISTGITAIDAGVTNFSVFPNPSNGVFTANVSLVAASDVTISVTDMTGSKIYESSDKAVKDLNKQINLSTIATGIYFVSVKTAQGTANQRIVIK